MGNANKGGGAEGSGFLGRAGGKHGENEEEENSNNDECEAPVAREYSPELLRFPCCLLP